MSKFAKKATLAETAAIGRGTRRPSVSIIIVSFNTIEALRECLRSASDAPSMPDCETIVIDNNSFDGSAEMVRAEFPSVTLICNDANLGFAQACNQGLRIASGRYLLLLNSDVQLFPDTLQKMVETMDRFTDVGAASCKLQNADGTVQASVRDFPSLRGEIFSALLLDRLFPSHPIIGSYLKRNLATDKDTEVDQVSGAFLIVRSEVVKAVGLLDERFFIYYEDVDWCFRIKKGGWRIMYHPGCSALHAGGRSANQFKSFPYVEGARSKILYFRKHYGLPPTILVQGLVMIEALLRSAVWLVGRVARAVKPNFPVDKGWSPAIAARICRVAAFPLHTRRSSTELANA